MVPIIDIEVCFCQSVVNRQKDDGFLHCYVKYFPTICPECYYRPINTSGFYPKRNRKITILDVYVRHSSVGAVMTKVGGLAARTPALSKVHSTKISIKTIIINDTCCIKKDVDLINNVSSIASKKINVLLQQFRVLTKESIVNPCYYGHRWDQKKRLYYSVSLLSG